MPGLIKVQWITPGIRLDVIVSFYLIEHLYRVRNITVQCQSSLPHHPTVDSFALCRPLTGRHELRSILSLNRRLQTFTVLFFLLLS